MVRVILVAIVSLSLGVAAGVILLPSGRGAAAGADAGVSQAKLDAFAKEAEALREQVTRLDQLNLTLTSQVDTIAGERDALKAAAAASVEAQEAIPAEGPVEEAVAAAPDDLQDDPRMRGRDGERADRGGRDREWRGDPEERRQAFGRMRERMDEFMLDQANNAPDKEAQNRIAQIAEYQQYQADLRQQLAETEDDAEREGLREELREAQDASTGLIREQQDALIRDVAASYGIKGDDAVAQFTTDLRATMENPFFRMGWSFGGGGPGGGGGRRGGWGGGGGGPGGGGRGGSGVEPGAQ